LEARLSWLFRFGAKSLVAAWTLLCLIAYVLVEFLGEAFVDQAGAIVGTPVAAVLAFLHDIGMVLLVLLWLIVAWTIWTASKMLGGRRS